jgi:hypothetical protein
LKILGVNLPMWGQSINVLWRPLTKWRTPSGTWAEHLVKGYKKLEKKIYPAPPVIDKEIARLKLAGMGMKIDQLTKEQKRYLASWEMGT